MEIRETPGVRKAGSQLIVYARNAAKAQPVTVAAR
jgi:hypothetical protein